MIAEAVDAELQSLTSVEAELMHIVRLLWRLCFSRSGMLRRGGVQLR